MQKVIDYLAEIGVHGGDEEPVDYLIASHRRQREQVQRYVESAKKTREAKEQQRQESLRPTEPVLQCAYCTWAYRGSTDSREVNETLRDHVEQFCPHHPLRSLETAMTLAVEMLSGDQASTEKDAVEKRKKTFSWTLSPRASRESRSRWRRDESRHDMGGLQGCRRGQGREGL